MWDKELQYLSRGQLHDIIREQDNIIGHLMDKLGTLDEDSVIFEKSVIFDEPLAMWDPNISKLTDVLDELGGKTYTSFSDIIKLTNVLDELGKGYTLKTELY